jgi:hypothetical protein
MKKIPIQYLLIALLFLFFSTLLFPRAYAADQTGRMGVGFSNQLANDIPAISFKLNKSRSFAFGGVLAMDTNAETGGFGAGVKIYRNFFEEPMLVFYGSLLGALIKKKQSTALEYSGFQIDLTLGSEFQFQQLESIGFSFEFGVSINKLQETAIETVGNHFVSAAIHFYL